MSDADEVKCLDRAWNEAYQRHDVERLEHLLADDWLGFTASHDLITKAMLLESQRQAPEGARSSFDEGSLHLFDNTAITTGRVTVKTTGVGLEQRFTRIYAKRNGRWQAVAVQLVPVEVS